MPQAFPPFVPISFPQFAPAPLAKLTGPQLEQWLQFQRRQVLANSGQLTGSNPTAMPLIRQAVMNPNAADLTGQTSAFGVGMLPSFESNKKMMLMSAP